VFCLLKTLLYILEIFVDLINMTVLLSALFNKESTDYESHWLLLNTGSDDSLRGLIHMNLPKPTILASAAVENRMFSSRPHGWVYGVLQRTIW
jgi:hypothetical protein